MTMKFECLWVRIKAKADILLGACYRLPDQEEEVDNLLYKQPENVSGSSALAPALARTSGKGEGACWEVMASEGCPAGGRKACRGQP